MMLRMMAMLMKMKMIIIMMTMLMTMLMIMMLMIVMVQENKAVLSDTKSPESKSKSSQGYFLQTVTRTFEKSVSSAVQASLHLPKINVMSLQVGIIIFGHQYNLNL